MVINAMQYMGSMFETGAVTGVTNGFALIPLPFRPQMVIAVYDNTNVVPTNRLSFYAFNGGAEFGYYCNSTTTVSWNVSNSYWDASTNTLHMRVVNSSTNQKNVAYIAAG